MSINAIKNAKNPASTCQVCGRKFYGRNRSGIYVGNCFGRVTRENFAKEERSRFWISKLNIIDIADAKIEREGIERYKVGELLELLVENDTLIKEKCAGVWALWINFGLEDAKCIQVAKNNNIYLEIKNDFINNKGSLDYKKYIENGTIIIVSKGKSDFAVEAQYAHDYKAEEWCPSITEAHQLGVLKNIYNKSIKISHNEYYIIISFDIKNEIAAVLENKADEFLINIFGNRDYNGIKRWLIARCGGKKTLEEAIELCKRNMGISVVDNIKIEIIS